MEAKIIDFKQPLENHLGKINKSREPKTKDFNITLNSINKKNDSKFESSSKLDKKEVKNSKDDTKKSVEELGEEVEKDEKILYEGMVNLLNINVQVEEEIKVNLEELEPILMEIKPTTLETEENTEEIVLDEEMVNLIDAHKENKNIENSHKENSKQLKTDDLKPANKEAVKTDLLTQNFTKIEVKLETNKSENDFSVEGEDNLINSNQLVVEETINEFEGSSQEQEDTKSESKYELVNATDTEENSKVSNESFGPFIKEGIEFSTELPIEAEVPIPVVEPKEVVKQIIDQVKFDLSESKNEMKLTLKPESLGEITMNVEVAKDGVIAKIMVDNYRTKEIIEGNIFQLKEGIKDTGMEIKTFEVFVGNGSDFDQHNFNGSNQFNLKQNSKKLRIKSEDNRGLKGYEDGIVEDRTKPLNYTTEGGLNLFA